MPQELREEQLACATGGTSSLLGGGHPTLGSTPPLKAGGAAPVPAGGGWPFNWCGTPVPKPLLFTKLTPTLDPYA